MIVALAVGKWLRIDASPGRCSSNLPKREDPEAISFSIDPGAVDVRPRNIRPIAVGDSSWLSGRVPGSKDGSAVQRATVHHQQHRADPDDNQACDASDRNAAGRAICLNGVRLPEVSGRFRIIDQADRALGMTWCGGMEIQRPSLPLFRIQPPSWSIR
jgi:hypothetical protein